MVGIVQKTLTVGEEKRRGTNTPGRKFCLHKIYIINIHTYIYSFPFRSVYIPISSERENKKKKVMKLQSSVVPLSVIAASHLVSALVIPDLSDEANLAAAKVALVNSELKSEISSLGKTVAHDVKQIFDEFEQRYGKTLQTLRENLENSNVRLAPLLSPITNSISAQLVPNRYIVVFKNTSSEDEIALHKEFVQQAHIQSVATLPSDHEVLYTVDRL